MLLTFASLIICSIVPTFNHLPGIVVPLSLINILSGDGKIHLNDGVGYFGTLLCFILPIVFFFVTRFAKTKTVKLFSFFLLLPFLFGAFNPVGFTYLIFAIIQIVLWTAVKE